MDLYNQGYKTIRLVSGGKEGQRAVSSRMAAKLYSRIRLDVVFNRDPSPARKAQQSVRVAVLPARCQSALSFVRHFSGLTAAVGEERGGRTPMRAGAIRSYLGSKVGHHHWPTTASHHSQTPLLDVTHIYHPCACVYSPCLSQSLFLTYIVSWWVSFETLSSYRSHLSWRL